jgi:dipeptidyl aminopeptidase/acylaminoacyl peptidase
MEDTHVWTIGADGSNRREIGRGIDNRQGAPEWSADGRAVLFTVQERGSSHLYRLPLTCSAGSSSCPAEKIVGDAGSVADVSVAKTIIAYTLATPSNPAELYVAGRKLTDVNAELLRGKRLAPVEALTFVSNDNKFEVEAFLTKPEGCTETVKCPLIVNIHGGPHGQQGPAFNFKNQVYASRGWATLMVNYRGSTGYGQAFTDAVFADQNGNEGQDVLYALSAAMRRNPWIDRDRLGVEGTSYGGQLSAWLITQTSVFKAAIPTAAIINLISHNYDLLQPVEQMEASSAPGQPDGHAARPIRDPPRRQRAHPTMLMHGENDNDVPIAEAEQFYIGLRDVGTEAVMVRAPARGTRHPRIETRGGQHRSEHPLVRTSFRRPKS